MLGIPVLAGLLLLFFSMFSFLVSTHPEIFAAIHLVSKSNLDLAPNRDTGMPANNIGKAISSCTASPILSTAAFPLLRALPSLCRDVQQ
jgi:hypothetical protein